MLDRDMDFRSRGVIMLLRTFAGAVAALSVVVPGLQGPANSQTYPSKTVTIVVPLAAGSGMDVLARLYADKLQGKLGKPVVIENKPGAALMLAAASVATAPPDGHTLVVSTGTVLAINPVLYKKVNYDPEKDFTPISFYVKAPFILVVNPELPVKSVPELIKYARETATPVTFASLGIGTPLHLAGEYMKPRYNVSLTHVPYRNTGQSLADLVAGHVNMSFAEVGATLPLIREGKLRVLAVTSSAAEPAGRSDLRGGDGRSGIRTGLVADAVRSIRDSEGDRAAPQPRDERDHGRSGDAEENQRQRPAARRDAFARRDPEVHRLRAREMGIAAAKARPARHAIGR
jgi:tripartite-type tricarboxylate transporter receptor subunit TctC